MRGARFVGWLVAVVWALFAAPAPAIACGGFLAARVPSDQTTAPDLRSDGSKVAIVRDGLRTVISLSMKYRGPPEDFALVVPVPVVLERAQVRTLPAEVLERLDAITRPRLVEQWEDYPCADEDEWDEARASSEGGTGARARGEEGSSGREPTPLVKVEASFSVDAYDVVVLGASDSMALEAWLRAQGYALPSKIEPFLRPYVAAGSKFFVAKVDPKKIDMSWGRAVLPPLQFRYDSESLTLPIRLGLANVDGDQDLTVWVLGKGRYEVANYESALVPTNLRLVEGAAGDFAAFYERLLADTFAKHPRSVLTELALDADACSGCGVDERVLEELGASPKTSPTVTRLHARYGPSFTEDFTFRAAAPLEGGDEPVGSGALPTAAGRTSDRNAFYARYFVRHPWKDEIDCARPRLGKWSGDARWTGRSTHPPRDAALDAWTFRGAEPEHAARSVYQRLDVLHSSEAFAAASGGILLAALVVVALLARRGASAGWSTAWRPSLQLLVLGLLPAAAALHPAAWRSVRDMPLPIAHVVVYVLAAAAVTLLTTNRPVRAAVAAVATAPLLVSCLAFRLAMDRLDLSDLDPAQAPRVFAEGEAEASAGIVWAAAASALLLGVLAWRCVDAPRTDAATPAPARDARVWALAIVASAIANGLAYGLALGDVRWTTVFAIASLAFSIAAAWRLRARPAAEDRDARATGASALVFGAALLVGAACLFAVRARGLGAVTGESVDPAQRARILDETFRRATALAWSLPVVALLTALPLALLGRLRPRPRALAPVVAVLLACAALGVSSARRLRGLYDRWAPPADARAWVDGVDAPEVSSAQADTLRLDDDHEGPSLLVTRDGALLGSVERSAAPRPMSDALFSSMAERTLRDPAEPLLVLDRSLTLARVDAALEPIAKRRHDTFRLQLGARGPRADGFYAILVAGPDQRGSVRMEWKRSIALEAARPGDTKDRFVPGAIAVRARGDVVTTIPLVGAHGRYRRVEGATSTRAAVDGGGAIAPSFAPLHRARVREYVLCLTPDTTAEALARLVLALEERPPPPSTMAMRARERRIWEEDHPETRFVVTTSEAPFE